MEALSLLFASVTASYNLPPNLINAVCKVESDYHITVIHQDDGNSASLGLCQIQPGTAAQMGFPGSTEYLMGVGVNASVAAKYLRYQYNRYGSWDKAVLAYNAGSYIVKNGKPINYKYLVKVRKAYGGNLP